LDEGFAGRGGYAGYDHGTCGGDRCRELYLYSAESGRLSCVSCNPLSSAATGDALVDVLPGVSATVPTQHLSHALSDDGQHVFFSSPEGLVAEDSNGKWDAYEYDTATGTVHLLSTGTSTTDSYFLDATPNASDAFIITRQRLTGWDIDDSYDIYDTRTGGGLPDPTPPIPPCAADGCKPPPATAPAAPTDASANFRGSGDESSKLKRPHKCKGRARPKTVRGKRKCVKTKTRTHKHHSRRHRAHRTNNTR